MPGKDDSGFTPGPSRASEVISSTDSSFGTTIEFVTPRGNDKTVTVPNRADGPPVPPPIGTPPGGKNPDPNNPDPPTDTARIADLLQGLHDLSVDIPGPGQATSIPVTSTSSSPLPIILIIAGLGGAGFYFYHKMKKGRA